MNKQAEQSDYDLPVYNIKAVARLVGLLPVTLRAWERRYGLPSPRRGEQGYRLYSEHDLQTLRWLKMRVDSGISIGRAAENLQDLRAAGTDPASNQPIAAISTQSSIETIQDRLYEALTHFDERASSEIIRQAFALYSVDLVLTDLIQPTLVEIGDAWHKGLIPIATEHYATQFCMQHLMGMINSSAPPSRPGTIIAACAPGEMHQIGLLILVAMLRWRGWDVKYLGPDMKLEQLDAALIPLHPRLILFSATRRESAAAMADLQDVLVRFPEPRPMVILGGQAWQEIRLPDSIPVTYIDASPTQTVEKIENFMRP